MVLNLYSFRYRRRITLKISTQTNGTLPSDHPTGQVEGLSKTIPLLGN